MANYITNLADVGYNYTVDGQTVDGSTLSNTSATEVTSPNISIYAESCIKNAKAGDTIAYAVTVSNSGSAITPENVIVTDSVPTGTTLVTGSVSVTRINADKSYTVLTASASAAAIGADEYFDDTTAPVKVTMNPLDASVSYVVKFSVTVDGTLTAPDTSHYTYADITDSASVSYSADTVTTPLASNTVTVTSDYAYITAAHTADATVICGNNPHYEISLTNYGNLAASGVVLTDYLPENFVFPTTTYTDHIKIFNGDDNITATVLGTVTFETTGAPANSSGLLTINFIAGQSIPGVTTAVVEGANVYTITSYRIEITGVIQCA